MMMSYLKNVIGSYKKTLMPAIIVVPIQAPLPGCKRERNDEVIKIW